MEESDYIVDIGPGAGIHGGKVVSAGTPAEVAADESSITGAYLSGRKRIEVPSVRRAGNGCWLTLLTDEVVEELVSAGEIGEAFDDYVSVNYPQDYENIDTYALYDMGYRTEGQILQADWDQLVKELINQRPVSLDENDIRSITNKVISEIKKRRKK